MERGGNNLSGGEKQRVALGRAILPDPLLLLMDEPLSALDDTLKFQIMHYLKRASERFGIRYLFISHSMLEIRLMTDQVLAMAGGRAVGYTTPEELARERMGQSLVGYINLLQIEKLRRLGGLYVYRWGMEELFVSAGDDWEMGLFELSSRDIILFTRHPEAVSAKNLLKCTVVDTFPSGNKVGVELKCGHETLIAEVVVQAGRPRHSGADRGVRGDQGLVLQAAWVATWQRCAGIAHRLHLEDRCLKAAPEEPSLIYVAPAKDNGRIAEKLEMNSPITTQRGANS